MPTQVKLKQCKLRSTSGSETLVTWLDVKPQLKPGAIISLKDFETPSKRWIVEEIYDIEISAEDIAWHRKWTNNI